MTDVFVRVAPEDPPIVSGLEDLIVQARTSDVAVSVSLADDMVVVPKLPDLNIVIRPADLAVAVSDIGPPGPQGTQGPPGGGIPIVISTAVNQPLGGQRVVKAVPGGVDYASSDDVASADAIVGITQTAAVLDAEVAVQTGAEMTDSSWAWVVGLAIYCGLNGVPTQIPPIAGFLCRVGKATAPTTILINVEEAIILA